MFDAVNFDRCDPVTGKTDNESGTLFVAEASMLRLPPGKALPKDFMFKNCPLPGMIRCFHFDRTDLSGDGDVAGWRFEEAPGPNCGNTSYKEPGSPKKCLPFTVLIIND